MVVDNPKPQYTPGLEHSVRIFIQEITYSNHAVFICTRVLRRVHVYASYKRKILGPLKIGTGFTTTVSCPDTFSSHRVCIEIIYILEFITLRAEPILLTHAENRLNRFKPCSFFMCAALFILLTTVNQ